MLKDLMNVVAGEMLDSAGFNPDYFVQQLQLMIIMIGSNPFFG